MTFFLGTHRPRWLSQLQGVPLFVSRRRLAPYKRLPLAVTDWALDSGGFTELSRYGCWTISPPEYVAEVRRYRDEIGRLLWASPMDHMCEPWLIERTGLSIVEHQRRTLVNYRELLDRAPDLPWIPVLQGWRADDYHRHADAYAAAGIDLARLPLVGLGTVCRRQATREAEQIVRSLAGLPLHAYGFKTSGVAKVAALLVSADSMAWSAAARHRVVLNGCPHRNCANCVRWALVWRTRVLAQIEASPAVPAQLSLAL